MNPLKRRISSYLSLVRFSHTIFAMPFALLGFFTAINTEGHQFTFRLLILVLLCMVFARNAAMGFNRYADHKFDSLNPRTAGREIPAGIIKPVSAFIFVIVNALLFIIAAGLINRLTLLLSPLALIIILGYSLTKRFTSLSHLILGLALSLAPSGAYISVTGSFDLVPVIYSLVVLFWVSGFDIIYSLQDSRFDKSNSLFSIPVVLGVKSSLILSFILHMLSIALIVSAGFLAGAGYLYWAGAVIFFILLIWEHVIVRPDNQTSILKAFGMINSYAGVIFCVFAIADLYLS